MNTIRLRVLDFIACKLLLVGCVLSIFAHPSSGLDIYVSQENGTLHESCWNNGRDEPCQTLGLALAGLERNSHTTVWIEPGTYHLNAEKNSTSDAHYKFYGMQDLAIIALSEEMNSADNIPCLLYTSPSPRDATLSRMPSSA